MSTSSSSGKKTSTKEKTKTPGEIVANVFNVMIKQYTETLKVAIDTAEGSTKPIMTVDDILNGADAEVNKNKRRIFAVSTNIKDHLTVLCSNLAEDANNVRNEGKLTSDLAKQANAAKDEGVLALFNSLFTATGKYSGVFATPSVGNAMKFNNSEKLFRYCGNELQKAIKIASSKDGFKEVDEGINEFLATQLYNFLLYISSFIAVNLTSATFNDNHYRSSLLLLTQKFTISEGKLQTVVVDFDNVVKNNKNSKSSIKFDDDVLEQARKMQEAKNKNKVDDLSYQATQQSSISNANTQTLQALLLAAHQNQANGH